MGCFVNIPHKNSGQKSTTRPPRHLQYLFVFLSLFPPPIAAAPITCGGTYRAFRGVIQTPDFPRRFNTPIDCEWIIDASQYDSYGANASDRSIVVYLTQVYIKRGLTFSDYEEVEGAETKIDVNLSIDTYVQSYANFLAIRLHLDSVVGTHIRVLNNFLDVYGLNITYEITTKIRNDSCKTSTCGFVGYCYYNFEKFFCDCFSGFEGPNCSDGPKSLCVRNGVRACENSTCKHVGEKFFICDSFVPKVLEPQLKHKSHLMVLSKPIKYQLQAIRGDDCDDCRISCPFAKKDKKICRCQKSLSKVHDVNDVGYTGHFVVYNILTALSKEVEDYLNETITQTLKTCNVSPDTLTINKLDRVDDNFHMYFHLFGSHENKNQLLSCFRKIIDGDLGNVSFFETKITLDVQPSVFLKNLRINKLQQPIYEGQEFILSCLAIGSPNMAFRWYKDNVFINITTPTKSNKWIQLVRKDLNAYWSVLVISEANELDEGLFTCQVADFGRQQCASQYVYVNMAPSVFIDPRSLTVKQGERFDIICREDSGVMVNNNRCKFKWLENGNSLTDNVEPIYPKGSLLKVPGIHENTIYSCTCEVEDFSKEVSIIVNVYDPAKEVPCKADNNTKNLEYWPDTAPGVSSLVGCPNNYSGFVTRICLLSYSVDSLKRRIIGRWTEPDYSGCLHDALNFIKINKLELGYASTTVLKIINGYENYVINRDGYILPSEGKQIFILLDDVLKYIENSSGSHNIRNITNVIFNITNHILSNTNAIYTKDDIVIMQKVVKTTLLLFARTYSGSHEFKRQKFNITITNKDNQQKLVCANFSNLTMRISEAKSEVSEHTLILISDIINVWLLNDDAKLKNELTVTVNITDKTRFDVWLEELKRNENNSEWQPQCVVSDWGFNWEEHACTTEIDKSLYLARCRCGTDGTFAVAYVKKFKISYASISANLVLIMFLYAISLILSVISVTLSLMQFQNTKSAVAFMQSHSSLSKLIICVIFTVGTFSKFCQESCLYILSTILFFYLLALSSLVSILMITYSELEDVVLKEIAKISIIEIFMLASILAAVGNHIAHASLALRSPSWWIKMADNLSFNVFTICLVVLAVLFITFYWIVWYFIKKEIVLGCVFIYKKYNRVKKCLYVFCAFLANIIISIFYINNVENLVLHYALVSSFILIDMILLFSSDDQKFHLMEIVSKMRKITKSKFEKSLKSMYIFNKN